MREGRLAAGAAALAERTRKLGVHGACLLSLGDLAGLEAARADVGAGLRALDHDPHLLEVRVKAPLGSDHGVGTALAEGRALPAAVTNTRHRCGKSSGFNCGVTRTNVRAQRATWPARSLST